MNYVKPSHEHVGSDNLVSAITHTDEITLELCRDALRAQTVQPKETRIVAGVSPASAAYNEALDFAWERRADFLLLVPADSILVRDAVHIMTKKMIQNRSFCVTAKGFDFVMLGNDMPTIARLFDMRVIRDEFRYRDMPNLDEDFFATVERETSESWHIAKPRMTLGYHHPVWRARELFECMLYNMPKYPIKQIRKCGATLQGCYRKNPQNKVLQVGMLGLDRGMSEPHNIGSRRDNMFEQEWNEIRELVNIRGTEYFAYHADMVRLGQRLLGAQEVVTPMAGDYFGWNSRHSGRSRMTLTQKERFAEGMRYVGQVLFSVAYRVYLWLPEPGKNVYRRAKFRFRATRTKSRSGAGKRTASVPAKSSPTIDWRKDESRKPQAVSRNFPIAVGQQSMKPSGGDKSWAIRWNKTDAARRVLLISPADYAGSMYKWAECINTTTQYAARLVTFGRHRYGYPNDVVVNPRSMGDREYLKGLVDDAAVLHLKDEYTWHRPRMENMFGETIRNIFLGEEFSSKPKVFTLYGGYARSFKECRYFIDTVSQFAARIVMTPDLNYDWVEGIYIPHAINAKTTEFSWRNSNIVSHSPSSSQRKGTYLFREAVSYLQATHPEFRKEWSVDVIHDVSFDECMRRKKRASLFFDQAGRDRTADVGVDDIIGWYGNSAIEAMVYGIPTIAHVSDVALRRAENAGVRISHLPVVPVQRSRSSMVEAIREFVSSSLEERVELAKRTRRFIEEFHSYDTCGRQLERVYQRVSSSDGA